MFVITNRQVLPGKTGLAQFGKTPNPEGPNELRAVEVTGSVSDPVVEIVPDTLPPAWRKKHGMSDAWLAGMQFDPAGDIFGSVYVAHQVLCRVNPACFGKKGVKGCNLLFFVHGYNNDMHAVVRRAMSLQERYGVEVVTFSWPANGGGAAGAAAYLSDKNDARASVGALDRTLAKAADYMQRLVDLRLEQIQKQAAAKAGDDLERYKALVAELADKECPFSVNLAIHSMGNYLYKQLVLSTASLGNRLFFNNIVLIAADTNNQKHAEWVDSIKARRRVFITINERDRALGLSRIKFGDEQLARLGHCRNNLDSEQGVYVDFTDAKYVTDSHAYFEGTPLKNRQVETFFRRALNGEPAEEDLFYDNAMGTYRMAQDRKTARGPVTTRRRTRLN